MNSNSNILGKISSSSATFHKTYLESRFYFKSYTSYSFHHLFEINKLKFYLEKSTGIILEDKIVNDDQSSYKELEILNINVNYNDNSTLYDVFFELIEKDILYSHLLDERNQINELLESIKEIRGLK